MSDFSISRFTATQPAVDLGRGLAFLDVALRTYLTRRELPELTARALADIGLSSSAALAEASRLPWDVNPRPRRDRSGFKARIQRALERLRTRRLMSRLEARELRELGLSPSNAEFEATKPFWRA